MENPSPQLSRVPCPALVQSPMPPIAGLNPLDFGRSATQVASDNAQSSNEAGPVGWNLGLSLEVEQLEIET